MKRETCHEGANSYGILTPLSYLATNKRHEHTVIKRETHHDMRVLFGCLYFLLVIDISRVIDQNSSTHDTNTGQTNCSTSTLYSICIACVPFA